MYGRKLTGVFLLSLRKSRKTVDSFAVMQEAIEADRKAIEQARSELNHTESKATSDKYTAKKAELDAINSEQDEAYKNRKKLFEERDANKKAIDELYTKKRELRDAFKAANDAYCMFVPATLC